MTTIPNPDDPDTGSSAVPPYDGRKETGEVSGAEQMHKDGANVGGATGPVESDELKAPPKEDTPRGATASPADEQPASEMSETETDPDAVGPDHYSGTGRAEDKS